MDTAFTYDRHITGKFFLGRKAEQEELEGILTRGANAVIYEPPKTGKTSLLRQTLLAMASGGIHITAVDVQLMSVRSAEDFTARLAGAVIGQFTTTPDEAEALRSKYFADGSLRSALTLPYRLAEERRERICVVLFEFQNVLLDDDPDRILQLFEEVVRKATPRQKEFCSWIWIGSMVNAMKEIFEHRRYFYRMVERVRISEISQKEIEAHVNKGFLVSGKVLGEDLLRDACARLRCNIYYINHLFAICDGLSKGFITAAVVEEGFLSLIAMHEPRFMATMNGLTNFQVRLLRAILDGESKFSSADTIARYRLNSSANVNRLKDALCKKEIVTFGPDGSALILDPLFEYWLRKYFFNI